MIYYTLSILNQNKLKLTKMATLVANLTFAISFFKPVYLFIVSNSFAAGVLYFIHLGMCR